MAPIFFCLFISILYFYRFIVFFSDYRVSKNILTKNLKAYCDYASHIHCLNPAFITGKEKDGKRIIRRAEGVMTCFYYIQSEEDHQKWLAEDASARPEPEEQVIIF